MSPKQITLRVQVCSFDTMLDSLVDDERVSIDVNTAKFLGYLLGDLPQEVLQPAREQWAVFLAHMHEAGDEASLIREYLGDLVTGDYNSADLPKALGALKSRGLPVEVSLEDLDAWVRNVVSALDEPYITKLVVAILMSRKEMPDEEDTFHKLFLSLNK